MQDKLKVVILLNSGEIPLWIFRTIDEIIRSGRVTVTLVISKSPASVKNVNLGNLAGFLIIRLIEKVDYMIFRTKKNYNLLKEVALFEQSARIINLTSDAGAGNGWQQDLAETLQGVSPDIIIRFGNHYLSESLKELPRYGTWALSVESAREPGNVDYGFWQVVRYKITSSSSVRVFSPLVRRWETLYESVESTCPFSVNKNRNQIFHRTALYLPRLIEGLHQGGEDYLVRQKDRHRNRADDSPDAEVSLGTVSVLKDTFRFISRVTPLVINKLLYTDAFSWHILAYRGVNEEPATEDFSRFKVLKSPRGIFWADPFVIFENERYFVFVEEFLYSRNKAHISVLELDPGGSLINHRKVIERPYHMSYPFIFSDGDNRYMIPETSSNNTMELYRCIDFPYTWEFEKVIMKDVSATDTTLFYYNGKWWLFTTLDQTGSVSGGSTELFLYYADSPLTDKWVSHPMNPVVSDETGARCAGNLFIRNGIIYRPAQDCSVRYGRGFSLKRVTVLNENEYNEIAGEEVKPTWDKKLRGTHTFNFSNGLTVIDTYKYHCRI